MGERPARRRGLGDTDAGQQSARAQDRAVAAALAGTAALVFLGVHTGGAQPPAPLSVIYSPSSAANVMYDGSTAVPGLTDALRQAPIFDDPRWPVARQIGKLSGKQLSTMTTDQMVATIQAELADPRWGGLAGIDEITVNDWDEAHAASLGAALQQLGPDADRVIVYAGPALVTQVGGVDLRQSLDHRLGLLVAALREAGATLLEMYHGTAGPFTREEFAVMPTRWFARWAPADPTRLHMPSDRTRASAGPGSSRGPAPPRPAARSSPTAPASTDCRPRSRGSTG